MAHGRWYPTNIIAADGKTFVLSGLDEYGAYNLLLEIYDPSTQTFTIKYAPNRSTTYCVGAGQTSCTGAGSPCYGSTNNGVIPNASQLSFYPRMHLMPSGLYLQSACPKMYGGWIHRLEHGILYLTLHNIGNMDHHFYFPFKIPLLKEVKS